MRVLLTAWAWRSHFYPLVPLGWALRAAGHEVCVLTQPALAGEVRDAGLPVATAGGDIDIAAVIAAQVGELALVRSTPEYWSAVTSRTRQSLGIFVAPAEAMAAEAVQFARSWQPDLVVYEPTSYVGPLVARLQGVPAVRHLWGPDVFSRFSDMEAANLQPLARRYGLPALDPLGDLTLDPCPAGLQVVGSFRRHRIRYVPYNGAGAEPAWVRDPPAAPRVCVSGGTSGTRLGGRRLDMVTEAAAAAAGAGFDVVAAVGPADRAVMGALPASVRVAESLPLQLVLPSCDVLVHQGGAGTTLTAIACGVPQLVLAQLPEMLFNGRQVSAAGAGHHLLRAETDAAEIAGKVRLLAGDRRYATATAALRRQGEAQTSLADTVDLLARYAAGGAGAAGAVGRPAVPAAAG